MSYQGWGYTAATGGFAGALDAEDGAGLTDGAFAVVLDGNVKFFKYNANSGLVANGTTIIAPVTNAGDGRWILQPGATDYRPIAGTITAFLPGYFTNNANGGYTSTVLTAAAINALINPGREYFCNGAACNVAGSDYYDGTGRYLPNLTDDRFFQGDTVAGVIGGSNTMAHTHAVDIASFDSGGTELTAAQNGPHDHVILSNGDGSGTYRYTGNTKYDGNDVSTESSGSGDPHSHTVNPPSTTSGPASNTENRAKFLSGFYKIQV